MPTFPLITHDRPERVIAWRRKEGSAGDDGPMQAVTARRFLQEVAALAALLPPGGHMLNACADRYRFMVGLCAALVAQKVSLLPSTTTPDTVRHLLEFAPDAFCLTDQAQCPIALPQFAYPRRQLAQDLDEAKADFEVPRLPGSQLAAWVFTSGSTGKPVPHPKTWGNLVVNVQAEARLWGMEATSSHAVVGTVPPQHMYGFESTVLVVMQSGNALVASQSFYPADICATLAALPHPRILVTTPVHLRSLTAMDSPLPCADLLVCATAPLPISLAREAETAFEAPLLEIYGSTETGQIAMRRSTQTAHWQLFSGIELKQDGEVTIASGGHIEQPTRMNDVIELAEDGRFILHGRHADMINIAGKRSSLAYLNLQLNAIPGVLDGAFYMPEESALGSVTRLTAFVVAPGLTPEALMTALRERVDAVFLPRPLHFVAQLPRNDTGKLPLEALKSLARELAGGSRKA